MIRKCLKVQVSNIVLFETFNYNNVQYILIIAPIQTVVNNILRNLIVKRVIALCRTQLLVDHETINVR
jgi:hypothetical protein